MKFLGSVVFAIRKLRYKSIHTIVYSLCFIVCRRKK